MTDKPQTTKNLITFLQAGLGATGVLILLSQSWRIALGVFICLWANNIFMGYVWKKQ